jgi:hypothetical protein
LNIVYYLFAHLALNHNTQVACDPTYPEIDESAFIDTDWKAIYEEIKEAVPIDSPTPLGKEVELRLYVDYDHAGEKFTRHSRTGVVICLNMAPIVWFSKAASYGGIECLWGRFFAMKNGIETVRWICFRL